VFNFHVFSPAAVSIETVNSTLLKHKCLPGGITNLIWLTVQTRDFTINQPGSRSDPLRRNPAWHLMSHLKIYKCADKTYFLTTGTEQNQNSYPHLVPSFDLFTQIKSSWKHNADKHKVMGALSYLWCEITLHKQIVRNHQYEGSRQRHVAVVKR